MHSTKFEQTYKSASGNTDNCAPVKTWGYGGAPNQKWVFEKATQRGCAGAYRQVDSTGVNCFGYALGLNKAVDPQRAIYSLETQEYNMERWYNLLVSIMHGQGLQCRKLSSKDAYIRPNEFKIVARSGDQKIKPLPYNRRVADSHFMVQINTGAWAEKMGKLPSENLGYINPNTYSWDFIKPDPDSGELINYYEGFYNSPLIYIAIWK